jgi:hypothetical protein
LYCFGSNLAAWFCRCARVAKRRFSGVTTAITVGGGVIRT